MVKKRKRAVASPKKEVFILSQFSRCVPNYTDINEVVSSIYWKERDALIQGVVNIIHGICQTFGKEEKEFINFLDNADKSQRIVQEVDKWMRGTDDIDVLKALLKTFSDDELSDMFHFIAYDENQVSQVSKHTIS